MAARILGYIVRMNRARMIWALTVAVLTVAGSANSLEAAQSSGVQGVVLVSHGCPGPIHLGQTQRCGHPDPGVLIRVFRGGSVAPIRSGRTDKDGRFDFPLAAGSYVLRVELKQEKTKAFVVQTASWTKLSLYYLVPPFME